MTTSSLTVAAEDASFSFEQTQVLLSEGNISAARPMLVKAMDDLRHHYQAYGKLVELAIAGRDRAALDELFAAHRAFPFQVPQAFQQRVAYFELRPQRETYNKAVQAALARNHASAVEGFAQLLGDEAFHRQAVAWLFRLAMQQKDFERAQFLAELNNVYQDDPSSSPALLGACAAQRQGDQEAALALLKGELERRNADAESEPVRLAAQQAVYLAMVRLHVELDQCFLDALESPEQARPFFPDIPERILSYMAR